MPGIRAIETLPGAVRGGYLAFVLAYEGAEMGGPSREDFVRAVRKEGVPLTADRYSQINYTYGMLHKAPLFTTVHRPDISGACCDPTRPWEETVRTESLPVSERLAEQLVSLPRLGTASRWYVRGCGRAIKKVLQGMGVREQARTRQEDRTPAQVESPVPTTVGA